MKHFYTVSFILINLLLPSSAAAASGDFGAWNLTTGHNGLNCGNVSFSEKELTLEFWIYIAEQDGKNIHETAIVSNRHDGSYGFTASLNKNTANGDQIDLRFWFKTVNDTIYTFRIPREEFSNKWNHVAFVISSKDKKASAYLNTELYDVIENMAGDWKGNIKADGNNVGNLWLAAWYTSPKLHGKLADVRVWNTARSIADIKANCREVLSETTPGLQKYYTFDDEVFAQKPVKLAIADDCLTWTAEGESWDVEVRSEDGNSVLKSETVTERSYPLTGLAPGSVVYVRTFNNGFYSGWAFKSDIIKLGCVGDSNTYGAEATDRSRYAWPVQIRSMLGDRYETRNFGVSGALMMNHLNDAWKNKSAYTENKAYDPDLIVIALGTNDSKDGYWDAAKFKASYIDLINELKSYPAAPGIYMALPIKAYSSSWSINDRTIRENVIPVMVEISKEMGLPLIDLYAVTNNIANLMASDGIHPKDEGLGIMARKIADILLLEKPVIEQNSNAVANAYAGYRWYKDEVLIDGADAAHYTAVEAGSYKVAVRLTAETNDVIVSEAVEVTRAGAVLSVTGNYSMSLPAPGIDRLSLVPFAAGIRVANGAGATLSFYDVGGRAIATRKLSSNEEYISTSFLTKGIYICRAHRDTAVTIKILK